eukprot:15501975-Heterocapsa_arctica.AAC.1
MANRSILLLAGAAVLLLQICAPRAFVQAPAAGALSSMVAAGSAVAFSPEMIDAQIMLARAPGGKFAKDKDLVLPVPEEDGFSDAQVATCLVIAGVAMLAALDLAKGLERGVNPIKYKTGGSKGSITPLVKRMIELGQ